MQVHIFTSTIKMVEPRQTFYFPVEYKKYYVVMLFGCSVCFCNVTCVLFILVFLFFIRFRSPSITSW